MIKATQFRQKCCLLATPAQIAEAASRPAREKVAHEAWALQTKMAASHPFLGAMQHPPKTQAPPGCSRESRGHQLRARPRLWHFLQLRPRQPLPPSRFELRFGHVERCRVAVG